MTSLGYVALEALARARKSAQQSRNTPWAATEDEILTLLYPDTPMSELIQRLQRSDRSIYQRARTLGLKRSKEFLASEHAGRLRKGSAVGKSSQFQKGHATWNKGRKGYQPGGRAKDTQFRRGNKPHTWVPIGTEQIRDGYLWRKITDHGGRHDWKQVHVMLWEEHRGPIPAGMILVFRDRNKQNIQLDNLELVTRAELCRRNSIHRYPPELKDVIRLQKKLERTIRNRLDEEPAD